MESTRRVREILLCAGESQQETSAGLPSQDAVDTLALRNYRAECILFTPFNEKGKTQ